jgi:hypothetical protein
MDKNTNFDRLMQGETVTTAVRLYATSLSNKNKRGFKTFDSHSDGHHLYIQILSREIFYDLKIFSPNVRLKIWLLKLKILVQCLCKK